MRDDLTQLSDAALVVAIGRWREDAMAEAYRRHGGAVYGLARRVVRDDGIAEEVVQEVFVRLWTRLTASTRSAAPSVLGSSPRRTGDRSTGCAPTAHAASGRSATPSARPRPATTSSARRWISVVAGRVNEAMGALPVAERQALELAYFDGYTYREVATILDTPEGTIKSRIRAGLKRLRTDLIDSETGQPWHHS